MTGVRAGSSDEPLLETSLESGFSKLERFVHFWVLVWRSFVRNRCPVRASALSYTTLLALIPMLAVAMSVTSMFLKTEGKAQIETFIQQMVANIIPNALDETNTTEIATAPQQSLTNSISDGSTTNLLSTATQTNVPIADVRVIAAQKNAANKIHEFIQNTYSGTLGVTGMFFLLMTAILTLTRVEETFNDIWGVTRGRDWWARIANYFTTIALGPTLLVAAFGLASGPHFQQTRDLLNIVPFIEPLISQLLPVVVVCVTFAMFYKLVPNTKVHFSAALVGGALAGTTWYVINFVSLHLASRALNANRIYGGLAIVPLFMGGLYLVWVTILFGAQVAYAYQNRESYLQEKLAENVNQRGREFVALRLMTCIGQRFHRGLLPTTVPEMSRELGIPSKLIQQVLQTLLAARLVVEVSGVEAAYAPARPLEAINCHHILLAMRATQGQELVTRDEPVRAEVYGEFARIQAAEKEAASTVTMLALVNRAHASIAISAPATAEKQATTVLPPADSVIANQPVVELTSAAIPAASPAANEPTETDNDHSFPL